MTELAAAILAVTGALFLALAALALHRMPDIYGRLSAVSKAVTLGAATLLAAAAVHASEPGVTARAIAGMAFLLLTSPIAGHVLGRASWRSGMEAKVSHVDDFPTGPDTPGGPSADVASQVRAREEAEAGEQESGPESR
jgi:multicomponent Na+:H+ antiporter subunit G